MNAKSFRSRHPITTRWNALTVQLYTLFASRFDIVEATGSSPVPPKFFKKYSKKNRTQNASQNANFSQEMWSVSK